ncbi:DUF1062 domain-containing protein, partial [Streptomyces decoyicus]
MLICRASRLCAALLFAADFSLKPVYFCAQGLGGHAHLPADRSPPLPRVHVRPTVLRRCPACTSDRFRANGKFRVNANHKLLDAWLLVLCTACGNTAKLTALER